MKWRIGFPVVLTTLLLTLSACGGQGGEGDESEIRQNAKDFAAAYNQKDAKALSGFWAEDADYINPRTGTTVQGREAIEEQYEEIFQDIGNVQLTLQIESIEFPSSNKAIERGTAIINIQGEDKMEATYRAVHEKIDGEWLLTQVSEAELEETPSHYEELKELDWLVGEWIDEDEDTKIETVGSWDKYKNFLTQHFTVTLQGKVQLEGKQIIAWDPYNEQIRSWVFDSDGGFGEGTWKKRGDQWIVDTAQTLADGSRASAINVYSDISRNSFTWESTGREVDGEFLPNIDPVTVNRK